MFQDILGFFDYLRLITSRLCLQIQSDTQREVRGRSHGSDEDFTAAQIKHTRVSDFAQRERHERSLSHRGPPGGDMELVQAGRQAPPPRATWRLSPV